MHNNPKTVQNSLMVSSIIVMPNHTNFFSFLMGGNLMKWMDVAAATAAMKHSNLKCVTVSVDNLTFKKSIHLGSTVRLEACVTRVFKSSMEIYLCAYEETYVPEYVSELTNEAYYTFVAVDDRGRPVAAPPVIPETDSEKERYEMALKRRQVRLFLANKISLSQEEILHLFMNS